MSGQRQSLRQQMPKVAEIVDRLRAQMGADWVNARITDGMEGKPDNFYAVEGGHIVGTPFTFDAALAEQMRVCFMVGGAGAVVRAKE